MALPTYITNEKQTNTNIKKTVLTDCLTCTHFKTCVIVKGLIQMMNQYFTKETMPFEPTQLSRICIEYISASAVTQLLKNIGE